MARELVDPVFGVLTQYQSGDWEFRYCSELFGETLAIGIEADANESEKPTEDTYRVFNWFSENQSSLRELIENVSFAHYQNILPEVRKSWGAEADARAPRLSAPNEIWELLSTPRVVLLSEGADLSISLETTWDPEHGLTFLFMDGNLVHVE